MLLFKKSDKIPLMGTAEKLQYLITFCVIVILFILATIYTNFNPIDVLSQQQIFWDFVTKDFMPPSFAKLGYVMEAILTTLEMAMGASFIGALLAFTLAFFGSNTIAPNAAIAKIVRAFGSFCRNIPALVWSIILVMAFGIGTTVGFIALIIETFGLLLRAYIETIDEVGFEGVEAFRSIGANFFQKLAQCIIPSAIPGYISWFLYSIELNIRSSSIVGMVGGGGIGLLLMSYIKQFNYHVAGAIILFIALMVILVDLITNWLRKKVLI